MKWIRPILTIALIVAAFGLGERSYYQKNKNSGKRNKDLVRPTPLHGGFFEASGVALAEGTNSVLFVDDSRPGEVFWMQFDGNAQQLGPIIPIPLGLQVEDPEGITFD